MRFASLSFALMLLALSIPPTFAAVDPDSLVRESVKRLDLQTEMPAPEVAAADDRFRFHIPPELARVLLWGAVIVGTAVTIWSLRNSLPVISRSRTITAAELTQPALARVERMDEAQIEADDLARQGQYSQAMHVLLLNSLDELRKQLGTGFAVSLTSREILRRVQLPDVGRQSLGAIIRNVERTYFGGSDAGESDYANCRTNFEALKQSLTTGHAA